MCERRGLLSVQRAGRDGWTVQDNQTQLLCEGQSNKKMSLIERVSGCVLGTMVAVASFGHVAHAQVSLRISDEAPLAVLPVGTSFATTTQGTLLSVNTDGFLFCANVYYPYPASPVPQTAVTLVAGHATWTLPTAFDLQSIAYTNGALNVNRALNGASLQTSLTCRARGPNGEMASPFSSFGDQIFRDNYEPGARLASTLNWTPPTTGFDWYAAADWVQVPTDSCTFDENPNRPQSVESSLCTAASGVRETASGSLNNPAYGDRAPTMWTWTGPVSGSNFVYLARVDVRFGLQSGTPNSHFPSANGPQIQALGSSVNVAIRDGYDSAILQGSGQYCFLRTLPTTGFNAGVCSDPAAYFVGTLNGSLSETVSVDSFTAAKSFYVAVIRQLKVAPPSTALPIAAIAVLPDPAVVREEGGDAFVGDDVVFGFMPGSSGFPWMTGQ